MRQGDLTTLGNVYAWLSTTNYMQPGGTGITNIQNLLAQLITRWSSAILSELERPWILPKAYVNEAYDGNGGDHQFLKNWPVTSVQRLAIGSIIVPPAPIIVGGPQPVSPGFGYRVEDWDGIPPGGPQAIDIVGVRYWMGKQNIQVSYNAGYLISNEPQTVPPPIDPAITSPLFVNQPYGIWGQDQGVTYANGTALTLVTSTPSVPGTYQVVAPDQGSPSDLTLPGQYVFFTGEGAGLPTDDTGSHILISYGFIPSALEQIAIELVCERFLYRSRIGEISRTVGQQVTAKYDMSEWPKYAMPVLQRYKNVLPL